jgi:precorrin-2 dehydrogenase/sirohydrochlorin ferrochelatase
MNENKQSEPEVAPVFPVALMPSGRECLVVGAGKAGARKAISLLEAGARVTVVAPLVQADVRDLAAEGKMTWRGRPFQPEDAAGAFIVFAATNDAAVNQLVLESCRTRNVLCGIVDHGWRQGDFISPAVLRRDDGLTVAVSTGGRSCRRSRMLRDSIGHHVEAMENASLTVIGASHACLPLAKREQAALAGDKLEAAGAMLRQVRGVQEFVLLNTCNRTECHAILSDNPETEALVRRLMGFDALGSGEHYVRRGFEAFQHAALLLAGLHSQSVGETHIVAQTKSAYAGAARAGWSGSLMEEWHASALHVSKAIRAASDPAPADLEDRCLDFLAASSGEAPAPGFLLIGSGAVGRRLMDRYLARFPTATATWLYHSRIPPVPPHGEGRVAVRPLGELSDCLPRMRTLVCASASPDPVLTAGHAALFGPSPVLVLDLGVPRNVDASLRNAGPALRVADLDDLDRNEGRDPPALEKMMETGTRLAAEHRDLYTKLMRGIGKPD